MGFNIVAQVHSLGAFFFGFFGVRPGLDDHLSPNCSSLEGEEAGPSLSGLLLRPLIVCSPSSLSIICPTNFRFTSRTISW